MSIHPEQHPLDGKLEPETKDCFNDRAPLYSIAISLKRIADAPSEAASYITELEGENEKLRLAICGGEDAPGYAVSLPLKTILSVCADNHATARRDAQMAWDGETATSWRARAEAAEAREKARHQQVNECEQIAGKALGYPWFKDDQKNFPGATEADGVCVGEHVAETIVEELANRLVAAEANSARLEEALRPFAQIVPSSLFPADGSEGEVYELFLTDDPCAPISGADLAKARAALEQTKGESA